MKIKIIFPVLCLLSACSLPIPSLTATGLPTVTTTSSSLPSAATATLPPLNLVPVTPATKLIMSVTNTGPASSAPFSIPEEGMYRINWQQASAGKFVLTVIHTDPAQAGTPYGSVTFESTQGPSARSSDYDFIAGEYKIVVEQADGPWKVWVEYIGPANQQ